MDLATYRLKYPCASKENTFCSTMYLHHYIRRGERKTFAQGACSQAISTPDARMDDGVATALGRRGVAWSERDRAVRRQLPAELSSCLALLLRIGPPLPAARRPEL